MRHFDLRNRKKQHSPFRHENGDKEKEVIKVNYVPSTSEAKYWLDIQEFEAIEAHAYNMSPADKRTVRRIIFEHFDYIVTEWNKFQEGKNG